MLARTGPFSNAKVIDLLNKHFAPIYIVNQDYNKTTGSAPPEEKAEFERIRQETWSSTKSPVNETRFSPFIAASRDIALYVLDPDGKVVDALRLPEIGQTDKVFAFLESMVKRLKAPAGETLVAPKTLSVPPKDRSADSLTLHVVTRYLTADGQRCPCPTEFDPILDAKTMSNRIRAASQLPAEKWFVLSPAEWASFVGPPDAQLGTSWDLDSEVLSKLIHHFYPPSENNDLSRNRILHQSLRGTVISVQDKTMRIRLDGAMKLKHPFVRIIEDDLCAECGFVGYIDVDRASRRVDSLYMVSVKGTYTQENFGVAMRSVP
jgi:hypothetical protein